MLRDKWIKGLLAIPGPVFLCLLPSDFTGAANPEPVTLDMNFLDPVTITENNPLQFGLLDVTMSNNRKVTIAPDGTVTDQFNNVLGGTQAAANLTVTATASQAITILVDNVSTANGYSLGSWMCNYDNAGSDSRCDGSTRNRSATPFCRSAVG